jgi:hypothetical protein
MKTHPAKGKTNLTVSGSIGAAHGATLCVNLSALP